MSTSQLQALLGAAQRQGLFALAQFVRAELQRRKDEENKRKKQKDVEKPDKNKPGPQPTKSADG